MKILWVQPRPKPDLIASYATAKLALSLSRRLDRESRRGRDWKPNCRSRPPRARPQERDKTTYASHDCAPVLVSIATLLFASSWRQTTIGQNRPASNLISQPKQSRAAYGRLLMVLTLYRKCANDIEKYSP
jgi:hypothetical protein